MKARFIAKAHGLSLIETLVALLILSVFIVSSASLQLRALRSTQQSYQQSIASLQMASFAEARQFDSQIYHPWLQQSQLLLPGASAKLSHGMLSLQWQKIQGEPAYSQCKNTNDVNCLFLELAG